MAGSRYIENEALLARHAREQTPSWRAAQARRALGSGNEEAWLQSVKEELPRFIPCLVNSCGVDFRGRILEIGAGAAWLGAELSKLPKVVEVVVTDASEELLKEQAPRVFELLGANTAKITRMPSDFHQLDFPDNHFDYVVSSAVLHDAVNIVLVLREAKRVLKPGGQFVAIREPVRPLVRIKSRARMLAKLVTTGVNERYYTLADYREFFRQAALPAEVKRINLHSGFRYYFDQMVNGLTHARYAFIGQKPGSPQPSGPGGVRKRVASARPQ